MCNWMTAVCAVTVSLSAAALSGCERLEQDACAHYGGYGAPVTGECGAAPDTHGLPEWQVAVYERYGAMPGGFGSYRHLGGLGIGQADLGRGAPRIAGDEQPRRAQAERNGPASGQAANGRD